MNCKISASLVYLALVLIARLEAFETTGNQYFDFDRFKYEFRKSYASPREELRRFKIWLENVKLIEEHNKKSGTSEFKLGVNQFADLVSKKSLSAIRSPERLRR